MPAAFPRPLLIADACHTRRGAQADRASTGTVPGKRHVAVRRGLPQRSGAYADTVDVAVALRMVLSMEGVTCRPK